MFSRKRMRKKDNLRRIDSKTEIWLHAKGSNNAIIIDVFNSRIAARWHVDRVAVYSTPRHNDCPLLHGQEMTAIKFYRQ